MTEPLHDEGSVWQGVLLCCGINFALVFTGCSVAWTLAERPGGSAVVNVAIVAALSVGLLQLLYVIPIGRAMRRNGRTQTLKGVTIGAAATALLNAAWLLLKTMQ